MEADISVSELARRLAGPDASRDQVDNQRTTVHRWLRGGGISDEKAERLAELFGKPLDHFKEPATDQMELDRLRHLAESILREVDSIQRRLNGSS